MHGEHGEQLNEHSNHFSNQVTRTSYQGWSRAKKGARESTSTANQRARNEHLRQLSSVQWRELTWWRGEWSTLSTSRCRTAWTAHDVGGGAASVGHAARSRPQQAPGTHSERCSSTRRTPCRLWIRSPTVSRKIGSTRVLGGGAAGDLRWGGGVAWTDWKRGSRDLVRHQGVDRGHKRSGTAVCTYEGGERTLDLALKKRPLPPFSWSHAKAFLVVC